MTNWRHLLTPCLFKKKMQVNVEGLWDGEWHLRQAIFNMPTTVPCLFPTPLILSVSSTIRAMGNAEPLICMTGIGKSDMGPQTRVGQQQPAFQRFIHTYCTCKHPVRSEFCTMFYCSSNWERLRTDLNIDNPIFAFLCVHLCTSCFCTSLMRSSFSD